MPESCPAPFVPGFFSPNPPIMPGGYYATFSVPSYFAPSYFSPNPPIMSGQHYASYVPQWFIPKRPTVLHSPVPPAPTHLRTDWDSRLPIYQIAASQQSYPESRGRSQSDSTSDHKRSRSSSCSNRDARACGFGRTTPTAVTRGNPTTAERPSGTDKPLPTRRRSNTVSGPDQDRPCEKPIVECIEKTFGIVIHGFMFCDPSGRCMALSADGRLTPVDDNVRYSGYSRNEPTVEPRSRSRRRSNSVSGHYHRSRVDQSGGRSIIERIERGYGIYILRFTFDDKPGGRRMVMLEEAGYRRIILANGRRVRFTKKQARSSSVGTGRW